MGSLRWSSKPNLSFHIAMADAASHDPPASRSAWQPSLSLPHRTQSPKQPGSKKLNNQQGVNNHPDQIKASPIASNPMNNTDPRFGFVAFAELWNGRLAMLGFVIGMATELLTGQGILAQVGLR